jgi:hypothetical protein
LNALSFSIGDGARYSLQNQTLRAMEINMVVEHDLKQWFSSSFSVGGEKNGDAPIVLILTVMFKKKL